MKYIRGLIIGSVVALAACGSPAPVVKTPAKAPVVDTAKKVVKDSAKVAKKDSVKAKVADKKADKKSK